LQFIAFSPDCRVRYNLMFYTGVKLRFSSWFSPDYIESARFRGLTAVNLQATATCNERRVVKSTYISGVGGGGLVVTGRMLAVKQTSYWCLVQGCTNTGTRLPGRLHFVRQRPLFLAPPHGTCFISPFWSLKFRGFS
jgi:hypothetical protein